jgi:hypothetical protein
MRASAVPPPTGPRPQIVNAAAAFEETLSTAFEETVHEQCRWSFIIMSVTAASPSWML